MKFNAYLEGGLYDKSLPTLNCDHFKVGMTFMIDDQKYIVLDGPIAKAFEDDQEGHDNLSVRCKFVGEEEE